MTVWNDTLHKQNPVIAPYRGDLINPASANVRLGNKIQRAHPLWERLSLNDLRCLCSGEIHLPLRMGHLLTDEEMEAYVAADYDMGSLPQWGPVEEFTETWIMPGEFILGHTEQRVSVPVNVALLMLCTSSTVRNGTHNLLGCWVDPGFDGELTLEMHNVAPWPFRIVPGMNFAQVVAFNLTGPAQSPYGQTGRYQGQTGPTPARAGR